MTRLGRSRSGAKTTFLLILTLILAGCGAAAFILFFEGGKPQLTLNSPLAYLGKNSTISVSAADSNSGLRQIRTTLTQGELIKELYHETFPRDGFTGTIGVAAREVEIAFDPVESSFKDGPATLELEAHDFSWRNFLKGNRTASVHQLTIDTTPPKVAILHSEQYIHPGGSGIVIYRSDPGIQSGVRINERFHPGFPVGDGRDDTYICYFGLSYAAEAIDSSSVVAIDPAGNESQVPFSTIYQKKKFRQAQISLSDGFLNDKIPEFAEHYPEMSGALVDQYLFTNNQVRRENNKKISDLCTAPHPQRLWEGRFDRMAGSTMAGFADHRTYHYQGKLIDQQVHLGIDLASTRRAEVRAAASGIVTFAGYLGIYGNMILIDHGQGVFSLYSHLSQINVAPGLQVDRDTVIGLTGTTGMAGGDHLHFSMLVNGVFVTPLEWWDQHWIDVTIEEPLTESRFQ